MKRKFMSKIEFDAVLKKSWKPVILEKKMLPDWMKNIPEDKVCMILGSGSYSDENPIEDGNLPSQNQIGGIDVYRYAEEGDGVNLNKDWYRVIEDPDDETLLTIIGPIKDSEHWIDDIPKRLNQAKILKKET